MTVKRLLQILIKITILFSSSTLTVASIWHSLSCQALEGGELTFPIWMAHFVFHGCGWIAVLFAGGYTGSFIAKFVKRYVFNPDNKTLDIKLSDIAAKLKPNPKHKYTNEEEVLDQKI